jgi:hypothetical protein
MTADRRPPSTARTGPDEDRRQPAGSPTPVTAIPEVRTRRLVVCDEDDRERIVAEVRNGQAQVRLSFVGPAPPAGPTAVGGGAPSASVVVFACPADGELGPLAGLQVWADGDVVAAIEAWRDGGGPWRAAVHPPGSTGPG